jgi:hypothetical protein
MTPPPVARSAEVLRRHRPEVVPVAPRADAVGDRWVQARLGVDVEAILTCPCIFLYG